MSGILVEFSLKANKKTSKELFLNLLDVSKTRGSDKQDYFSNENQLQIGVNSFIDFEKNNSNGIGQSEKYSAVYDGRIYNLMELGKSISSKTFSSNFEILFQLFDHFGIEETIQKLDGSFAIVIYEKTTNNLIFARDFAGIKPLFYGFSKQTLVVTQQYDQLLKHPEFYSSEIDNEVLKLYLKQHFIPAPFGLYKNTFQVYPGEIIHFSNGKLTKKQYWELPDDPDIEIFDKSEAMELITEVMIGNISYIGSNSHFGSFLSGGVDSPLLCSFLKEKKNDFPVFTMGSDSRVHDESTRAREFSEALDLHQTILKLDADKMMKSWNEAIHSLHEPFADFSILPTYLLSKEARKHVPTIFSADGPDELFFGYERFWSVGKNIRFQNYPSLMRKAIYGFDKYTTGNKRVNSVLLSHYQGRAHEGLHSRFNPEWLHKIFPELEKNSFPEEWKVYNYDNSKDIRTLLHYMRKAEFYGMMQKTLRKVDLASMENGLEIEIPFLRKNMIEVALKVDPLLSYGSGQKKQILKDVLFNRIPSMKDDNLKKGFSIPLSGWIQKELKNPFLDLCEQDVLRDFGVNIKQLKNMLTIHMEGKRDFKWPLFTIFSLAHFANQVKSL